MRNFLISLVALLSVSCADQHNSVNHLRDRNFEFHPEELHLTADSTFLVLNEIGMPIGAAQILIGEEPGKPFPGNVLTSDQNGLTVIPEDWKADLPVTISAPGYITRTIPDSAPGSHTIRLTKQEAPNRFEVKGNTTGFGRLVTDGKVDFSLVMPTIKRSQLMSFDLSMVVSSDFDTISVLNNDFQIPSNITLPDQRETYIFSIQLNKPQYRHILREAGDYQFFASHGQFPIQRVVGDIRAGKSIFEVINYFNFLGGGYKSTTVNGNVAGQDIAVNEVTFNSMLPVQAPTIPNDKMMFSLSLSEQAGAMTPFDVKRLTSGAITQLKSLANTGIPHVISMMMPNNASVTRPLINSELIDIWPLGQPVRINPMANTDFSQLSINVQTASGTVQPSFIPGLATPIVTADQIHLTPPALPADLYAVATYAVFAEIETTGTGQFKNEIRTRLWEMHSDGWVSGFNLPKISFAKNANRTYRWEVMFLARPQGIAPNPMPEGEIDLSTITHISRNVKVM